MARKCFERKSYFITVHTPDQTGKDTLEAVATACGGRSDVQSPLGHIRFSCNKALACWRKIHDNSYRVVAV